jgi:hypothetical protein
MTTYEICKVPRYNVSYDRAEKSVKTIETISALLHTDLNAHERLGKEDLIKLFVDVDKIAIHRPDVNTAEFFEKVLIDVAEYVGIDKNEISYTHSPLHPTGSYHIAIPKYFMTSSLQKPYWEKFTKKYGYGKEIDVDGVLGKDCWFRLPNQTTNDYHTKEGVFHEGKHFPHNIIKGEMKDFVLKYIEEATELKMDCKITEAKAVTEKKKPLIKKKMVILEEETDGETDKESEAKMKKTCNQELLDLIEMKNPKDRKVWFSVCAGIKGAGMKEADWFWFCKRNKLNMDEEKKNMFRNLDGTSVENLMYLAKKCNPVDYKDWLNKWNKYLTIEILNKGENDVSKFITAELSQTLKFCLNMWWYFNKETGLWIKFKNPTAVIISFIQRKIDETLSIVQMKLENAEEEEYKKLVKERDELNKHYKMCGKGSYSSQVIKILLTYLTDDGFLDKLDNTLYKMVFKNGIFDLKTMTFHQGIHYEDYITKTIPFNYEVPDKNDVEWVKNQLLKICNFNQTHLEYYLSSFGYALTGDSGKEQMFNYFRGQTASNGKSIILEALENIMPNYVAKANKDFMDKGADLRKEVATWLGLKILWINEVSTKLKDEDMVKAICDGTSYKFNKLYAEEAVIMPIRFKLFAVSNNSLNIKGDAGVERRFKLAQFNSQFQEYYLEDNVEKLEFKKDKDFRGKLEGKYKHALIYLLMTYANTYYEDKCLKPYPDDWSEEAKECMESNNKFKNWLECCIVKDEHGVYTSGEMWKKDIENMLPPELKNINLKDEFTKLKIPFKYESQKKDKGKKKFTDL